MSVSHNTPTLLFINLPLKTFIGLDLLSFTSSPQFRGITAVPQGLHFLYTGIDPSLSIRHGRWFYVPRLKTGSSGPCPLVWQWDIKEESLQLLPHGEDEVAREPAAAGRQNGLIDYTALNSASIDLKAKESGPKDVVEQEDLETAGEDSSTWPELTTNISAALLDRILCSAPVVLDNSLKVTESARGGHHRAQTSMQSWSITSLTSTLSETTSTAEEIPGLSASESAPILAKYTEDGWLSLLPIDLSRTFPAASTGAIRTAAARDRSWYLGHLIDEVGANCTAPRYKKSYDCELPGNSPSPLGENREAGAQQLIGELQFTFLMVLTISSYSCLEGWKRILEVILTCSTAIAEVPGFFVIALKTVRSQVSMFEEVEGGLFELSGSAGEGAWLRRLLRRFRAAVDEALVPSGAKGTRDVSEELAKLETIMRDRYGWEDVGGSVLRRGMVQLEDGEEVEVQMDGFDEEEETGEWAPVVVDLD